VIGTDYPRSGVVDTAVFTAGQQMTMYTREQDPSTRAVFKSARDTLPVFTGRADGPSSRLLWTSAREHGP